MPIVSEASGMGIASGLVGAGGTLGGALFTVLFKGFLYNQQKAFLIMGCIVLSSSLCSLFLRVEGEGVFCLLSSRREHKDKKGKNRMEVEEDEDRDKGALSGTVATALRI